MLEIAEVNYAKKELKVVGSDNPVPFDDVLFLTDPEQPDRNLTSYFANGNPQLNDRVKGLSGKPPQPAAAAPEVKKKSTKK